MIRILLLDSQSLTAQGVMALLAGSDFAITHAKFKTLADIDKALLKHPSDIIIIDPFNNDESVDDAILDQLKSLSKTVPVISLTNIARPESLRLLIATGIRHHLSKQSSPTEIFECLASALRGDPYNCSVLIKLLIRETEPHPSSATLSDREKEILILIADGKADKEIADALFLSFHTVRTHRKNIGRKVGFSLKNATELTLLANSLR